MAREDLADISDPDAYARGVPHDVFRTLRKEAPVYFQKERKGRGLWALTKYEDIGPRGRAPRGLQRTRSAMGACVPVPCATGAPSRLGGRIEKEQPSIH